MRAFVCGRRNLTIEAIHIKVFDLDGFDHLAEPLKYGYEIETRWPLADGAGAGSGRVITYAQVVIILLYES